jgi:NAD(P)-dependent dehydrogenase (short-subunit alcohol dehydrogenase family)
VHTRPNNVVITGASTGIGAACALYLAARDVRVFAGVRNAADGAALRAQNPAWITPVQIDVTDRASIAAAAQSIQALTGEAGLGGLVNNAGIAIGGPLEAMPLDAIRRQFEVNVIGPVAMTQALLPLLRQGRGRIVNIGSIAGRVSLPFVGPYSMSKSAVNAMTTALRLELDMWGIDVSLIEPGAIATPFWKKSNDTVDALQSAPEHAAWSLYAGHLQGMRGMVADVERHAISATAVARAVAHALTARRPRLRYLVGADAWLRAGLAAILPERAQDTLHKWLFKLPRRR